MLAAKTDFAGELSLVLDPRTIELLRHRRQTATVRRRGWLVRRMLLIADMLGLGAAFVLALVIFGSQGSIRWELEVGAFFATLPVWIVLAKIYGLYEHDEERTDHSTVDDLVGVFHLVTVGAWILFGGTWVLGVSEPNLAKLFAFWAAASVLIVTTRSLARLYSRRRIEYLQNTVIVGAGTVGQLIARKLLQHPEYGINLVGFVDAQPKERRPDLEHLTILGPPEQLPAIISVLDIERVIFAFSNAANERTIELIRSLTRFNVQIDVVPRLFEVVGPGVAIHTLEGLPLVGLPPVRLSPSSRLVKRAIDIAGSCLGLVVLAPLIAVIAFLIKRDSGGPIFFRQKRLGMDMKEFTLLKFRTMRVGTDDATHRAYIKSSTDPEAVPTTSGLYKLDREDAVTPIGRWLRRTSLDEIPQLINVLRGDMSLVGPRPCLAYEVDHFAPHQFDRFSVPAGITGLWQVTARAHASFGEALDMDVAYARSWSLGLDISLLLRTVRHVLRANATA